MSRGYRARKKARWKLSTEREKGSASAPVSFGGPSASERPELYI